MKKTLMLAIAMFISLSAFAETGRYGSVYLTGRAYLPIGSGISYAMVCDVNGPDGFLSVRSQPLVANNIQRNLKRLAIVQVNANYRRGDWLPVLTAFRNHSEDGDRLADQKNLHVSGWANINYLCDFID